MLLEREQSHLRGAGAPTGTRTRDPCSYTGPPLDLVEWMGVLMGGNECVPQEDPPMVGEISTIGVLLNGVNCTGFLTRQEGAGTVSKAAHAASSEGGGGDLLLAYLE